jgi:hypothetical protein
MVTASDSMTGHAEQQQYQADDQNDHADRPQDRDPGHEPDDQQDNPDEYHQVCLQGELSSKSPVACPAMFAGPEFASTDFHPATVALLVASHGWPGTSGGDVIGSGAVAIIQTSFHREASEVPSGIHPAPVG